MAPSKKTVTSKKLSELNSYVGDLVAQIFTKLKKGSIEYVLEGSTISPEKFSKQLQSICVSKVTDYLAELFNKEGIILNTLELEKMESRAFERQLKALRFGNETTPVDKPIQWRELSAEEIADCRLAETRRQWLSELEERRIMATAMLETTNANLAVAKQHIEKLQKEGDEILNRLSATTKLVGEALDVEDAAASKSDSESQDSSSEDGNADQSIHSNVSSVPMGWHDTMSSLGASTN